MIFNTVYYRHHKTPPEQNSGELKVERSGYVPAKIRIENLLNAGQRLVQSRKEAYDFPDGKIDPDFYDPTRRKNYDMAEAFQDNLQAQERIHRSQTVQNQLREAEKTKTDQNPVKDELPF